MRLRAVLELGGKTATGVEVPRTVEVPDDLAAAIDTEPGLRDVWDRLAYTHRREHVRAVEEAKKAETRARRVEKAIETLRARR